MKQINKNAKKWFKIADDDLLFAKGKSLLMPMAKNQLIQKALLPAMMH